VDPLFLLARTGHQLHPFLITSTLKPEAACISETSSTLPTSVLLKYAGAELISTVNQRDNLTPLMDSDITLKQPPVRGRYLD
jgi:hypothetical protein